MPANSLLHVTNGDSAAEWIGKLNLPGEILPWRDVLHDGPVPDSDQVELSKVRSRFLASCGWDNYRQILQDFQKRDQQLAGRLHTSEIVLWFEHDLYDQLQLCQILDRLLHQVKRCALINPGQHLTALSQEQLLTLFNSRQTLQQPQIEAGSLAWKAFTNPDPTGLLSVQQVIGEQLPFLVQALARLLAEFPDTQDGLALSERRILTSLRNAPKTPVELFRHCNSLEDASYLGDASFWQYLQRLSSGRHPLIEPKLQAPVLVPEQCPTDLGFFKKVIKLSAAGQSVLNNKANAVKLNGIDRWIGGSHLTTGKFWAFDKDQNTLILAGF